MNTSEYAHALAKKHSVDHALRIVEQCEALSKGLMTAEEVPAVGDEVEVVEETFKAKDGSLQTRERIKVDHALQNKRLKKSYAFWHEIANIIRKMKAKAEQNKNAQAKT